MSAGCIYVSCKDREPEKHEARDVSVVSGGMRRTEGNRPGARRKMQSIYFTDISTRL